MKLKVLLILFTLIWSSQIFANAHTVLIIQSDSVSIPPSNPMPTSGLSDSKESKKKYKLSISYGSLSTKSSPVLYSVTDNIMEAASNDIIVSYTEIPSFNLKSFYLVEKHEYPERLVRFPLFGLNLERKISNSFYLRTGLSLFSTNFLGSDIKKVIRDIDFDHAVVFTNRGDLYLFELGTNYHLSNKKWKPYFGLSLLFNFVKTTYKGFIIYGNDKSTTANLSYKDIYTNWSLGFYAFNCEVGMNYKLNERFEVGLDLHTFGAPFYRDFTVPLPSVHLNFLFKKK